MRYIGIVVVEGDLFVICYGDGKYCWLLDLLVVGGFQQPHEGSGGFGSVITYLRERKRSRDGT
ncbi:hypothetical protein HanXRQr2_Chr03g0087241 [Helianthus annuus]|uniref:Uncharacterized protein n=2 Tax=Helianthus annuus TaxID=4232 RepID=A0A251V654_HELAN|nr:hypothetical protein HanXRQr2_Chr03g0087241 [Helianthus annuus]